MTKPKLSIIIHAEEEFNWDRGFFRSNTDVSHGRELIDFVDDIINNGAKVTLAMDYPFIKSSDGKEVINHFRRLEGKDIEFASHLHPWVTPPYDDDNDEVENYFSFPGNLTKESEFNKLKNLTDEIEKETGTRPITYLAGRYGFGRNSEEILKSLGYKVDLSISSYTNFTENGGPNFTDYSNEVYSENTITYIPHTCSIISFSKMIEDHFNKNPSSLKIFEKSKITALISKILRIKKYRLSPEGFSVSEMIEVTEAQLRLGQREFILSFHSPSTKIGMTPYVNNQKELDDFKKSVLDYIGWFNNNLNGMAFLPKCL